MESKKVQQHPRLGKNVLPGCNLMELSHQQVLELKQALWQHGVIVVKQQHLSALQLKEFAKQTFQDLTVGSRDKPLDPEIDPNLQSPGVAILGNPKGHTQEVVGKIAWQWHHDKDHLPKAEGLAMNSLYVVMLYGVEIPEQGSDGEPHTTEFLDMVEAYNLLAPAHQRELEQMSMYHFSPVAAQPGAALPFKAHPVVSTHKVTGQKGLYLGSDTSIPVEMKEQPELGKQFWLSLFETVLENTPIYAHFWEQGDIVFWDNSQVMHTGIPYDPSKHKRIALRVGAVDKTYS